MGISFGIRGPQSAKEGNQVETAQGRKGERTISFRPLTDLVGVVGHCHQLVIGFQTRFLPAPSLAISVDSGVSARNEVEERIGAEQIRDGLFFIVTAKAAILRGRRHGTRRQLLK